MSTNDKLSFLHEALALAELRRGFCAPNPAVGAVVVKDGQIVGRGYHLGHGQPHAEVMALQSLDVSPQHVLYVTLEPCCHHGRTPPCTDLIIQKKVSRVVYAYSDPNPQVAGHGHEILQQAGIIYEHLPTDKINHFYESYAWWWRTQRPYVTFKIAMSMNGKIAGHEGQRVQLTGDEIAEFTHQQRKRTDVILTTATTVLNDEPQMNARIGEDEIKKPIAILDQRLRLQPGLRIFESAGPIYLFHAPNVPEEKRAAWQKLGVQCYAVTTNAQDLSLLEVLQTLGQIGFHDVWVEAGATLLNNLSEEKLLNRIYLYIAPTWLDEGAMNGFQSKGMLSAAKVVKWQQFGRDALCEMVWRDNA